MAEMSAADDVFSRLSVSLAPLVVHPLQRSQDKPVSLKGFARVGDHGVRIIFTTDVAGVAIEFSLIENDELLSVPDAVAFLHDVAGRLAGEVDPVQHSDGQGNIIRNARELGFSNAERYRDVDLKIYSFISVLESGGGAPWFEALFTFRGLVHSGQNSMRIYLRLNKRSETIGIDIPILTSSGDPRGFTALPNELAALVGDEQTFGILPDRATDDYCENAVDMSEWLGVNRT